jgi:MFS family permease
LEDNKNQEIDNPLAHLPPPEIRRGARKFARRHFAGEGLAGLFEKAALVARDPLNFRSVPGLTRKECNVLARESTTSFWSQSKALRITIVALGLSAVVQGWIQTNMNGSNLTWPAQFGLAYPGGTLKGTRETWIFASVNAITHLAAGVFGCWLSDPLNEFVYGRRGAIFLSAIFCFASVIGGACTHSWKQLFACRFLLGIGMGAKASVTPIWGAEVSPAHLRGSLVMNWQLLDTVGILFGFSSNLVVSRIGPLSWRFQFASAFLPTVPLIALVFVCPESPRFLLKRGRYREAYQSLLQLREIPLQVCMFVCSPLPRRANYS